MSDGRTIDYAYNTDNVFYPNKVIYGVASTSSGIEST